MFFNCCRGRRRGRGISVAADSPATTAQTFQSDDVYEFRSSPESDVGVNVSFLLSYLMFIYLISILLI